MGRDPHDDIDRRLPPARHRGPVRPLSDRAARFAGRVAATDRRERHRRRRREIDQVRRARRRRRQAAVVVSVSTTAVALAVVGGVLAGGLGALAGVAVTLVGAVGTLVVRRFAARRGAVAWDWQLQRHRLIGNPSERVRTSDDPDRDRRRWI